MAATANLYAELRVDPTDVALRAVLSDCLEEEGDSEGAQAFRDNLIRLAELDREAARLLASCKLPPFTFPKRFARNALHLWNMSPKQYRLLWDFAYRFRSQVRQLGGREVVNVAERLYEIRGLMWKMDRVPRIEAVDKLTRIAPAFIGYEDLVEGVNP